MNRNSQAMISGNRWLDESLKMPRHK